jgi:hypothetical protein
MHNALMAKKQKEEDRHKPSRMVRLPERMARALEEFAKGRENTLADEVRTAVREYLERNGMWPPKQEDAE